MELKEDVGSKLRALRSFMVEQKNLLLIALVLGFSERYDVLAPVG